MFIGKSADEHRRFESSHFGSVGALVMGRRMVDLGIGPWGEDPTFHAPCFVVTHRSAEIIVKRGGTSYIFVTEGIETALEQARKAAGSKDILVNGGADIGRQFLKGGQLQELRLHLVPVILGGGTRLFAGDVPAVRFIHRKAMSEAFVTHLVCDLAPAADEHNGRGV